MGNKKKSFQGTHPKILPWTWYCITCHNKSESTLGINRQSLLEGKAQDIHFHNSGRNIENTFACPNSRGTGSKPPSYILCVGSFLHRCPLVLSVHRNRSGITREQEWTKAYFIFHTLSSTALDLFVWSYTLPGIFYPDTCASPWRRHSTVTRFMTLASNSYRHRYSSNPIFKFLEGLGRKLKEHLMRCYETRALALPLSQDTWVDLANHSTSPDLRYHLLV